ncbi:hypothetical protein F5Y11DRAFT_317496 [Daldinia sp. FL1419]|nr:hypothetical protein F5Y11DRAFT_317496 [Daldinia sp. FL1419]
MSPPKRKYDQIEDDDDLIPSTYGVSKPSQIKPSQVTRSRTKRAKTSTGSKTVAGSRFNIEDAHINKPEPQGQPPAWAEKRAAMNDALTYFKAHQGSMHTNDLIPQGMLIDAIVGEHDYFSSQVIVTSIGGGRVLDPTTGQMVRTEDQGNDGKNYRAMKRAWETKHPFVMIAGARNNNFPIKPPHYYNVLDYFYVTDIWQEKAKGGKGDPVTVHMVRLEKVDLKNRSWWAPKDSSAHDAGEYHIGEYSCAVSICPTCRTSTKEIFVQGWVCINKECADFFQFATSFDIDELEYNDAFLRERTKYAGASFVSKLVPELPALPSNDSSALGSEKEYKQGIVCPKCRCCSRRIRWDSWYCENEGCDFTHVVPIQMAQLGNIEREHQQVEGKKGFATGSSCGLISTRTYESIIGGQNVKTFFLPDEGRGYIGTVTRIRPTEGACARKGGLDDLYFRLQKEDLRLERRPAKNSGCRVEELTSHFSGNFGAPYKFGVVVKTTTGFEDAPAPILETLLRLTWAGKTAVEVSGNLIRDKNVPVTADAIPSDFEPYNEQLVLGYFEKSKISAHDDGEKELGPNVASLSLGSPSVMKFYPKKNKTIGDTTDIGKKLRRSILSVELRHGDMLVMHGEQIQKLYLHSVEPHGKHRFALTCRHIRLDKMTNAEEKALTTTAGRIPDCWADIRYDGEKDLFRSCTTGEAITNPETTIGSAESM